MWVCPSMKPGVTTWPAASISSCPRSAIFPMVAMRSPTTPTSARNDPSPEPSMTVPPRITMSNDMGPPTSAIYGHILGQMAPSTEIHARLSRPVIDIDGNMAEHFPTLAPYFEAEGLSFDHPSLRQLLPTYGGTDASWYDQTPEERAARRTPRGPWGSSPAGRTIDLATRLFPALLYERLDDMGLDFSVVYPSLGLLFLHADDETYRRGTCRALNRANAHTFAPLADRLCPVAAIPMHTPEEAVAEP